MVALNKTYRKTLTPDRSAKDSGHRFYSAEISRWLNRDPIGEDGGLNLYVFARNNAVMKVDSFGTDVRVKQWLGHFFIDTDMCGPWGFGPASANILGGPGQIFQDVGPYLTSPVVLVTYDDTCFEQYVCTMISQSLDSPPSFNLFTYNCLNWVQDILWDAAACVILDPCCEGVITMPLP